MASNNVYELARQINNFYIKTVSNIFTTVIAILLLWSIMKLMKYFSAHLTENMNSLSIHNNYN